MKSEMKNTVMNHAVMKMAKVKNNVIHNTTRENIMMKSAVLKNAVMKTVMMKNVVENVVMENAKKIFLTPIRWLGPFSLSVFVLGCASSPDATCPLPQDGVCAALHTVDTAWDEKVKKASSQKKKEHALSSNEMLKDDKQDEGIVWFFLNTEKRNANAQAQTQIPTHHLIEVNHA